VYGFDIVTVHLDGIPVWRSATPWPRWLDPQTEQDRVRVHRASCRAAAKAAEAAREAVILAVRVGDAVRYEEGEEWGTLSIPAKTGKPLVASARGVYRALTGGRAGDAGWSSWISEITAPVAPVAASRRARNSWLCQEMLETYH